MSDEDGPYFKEVDGVPVAITREEWSALGTTRALHPKWQVASDRIGDVVFSTVFNGLPLNAPGPDEPPLCYETAAIPRAGEVTVPGRYATRAEALEGHRRIVEAARAPLPP